MITLKSIMDQMAGNNDILITKSREPGVIIDVNKASFSEVVKMYSQYVKSLKYDENGVVLIELF